ncbi:hypothetical protein FQA39_LY02495 [Lamprigera yunnana]|nr:hypothetical protein FQA39_LY02495 [Lamprigera yunnana]
MLCYSQAEIARHRVKRKVLFSKNSKLFFRLNGKANVVPWIQILAHGWAFRVNWDLPDTTFRRHKFFKREIHNVQDNLKNIHGYSCVLSHICQYVNNIKISKKCGIFCEIGKIISRSQGVEVDYLYTMHDICRNVGDCSNLFKDSFD